MITGQAARTSRLIATNAAGAGTRLRSIPASRAGSPPMRSGVSAHAASPKAFSTNESQSDIRWPSPFTIHWIRQARARRSAATKPTQIRCACSGVIRGARYR